jgi:hypothetical protein
MAQGAMQASGQTREDTARALLWMLAGAAARGLLLARIEGPLDHDQSVVGLMALAIAAGRRCPIFFRRTLDGHALVRHRSLLYPELM